jgi:hypothetical protein
MTGVASSHLDDSIGGGDNGRWDWETIREGDAEEDVGRFGTTGCFLTSSLTQDTEEEIYK